MASRRVRVPYGYQYFVFAGCLQHAGHCSPVILRFREATSSLVKQKVLEKVRNGQIQPTIIERLEDRKSVSFVGNFDPNDLALAFEIIDPSKERVYGLFGVHFG
jgi:hypothetical protein